MPIVVNNTGAGNTTEAVLLSQEPQNATLLASPTFHLSGNGGPTSKYHLQAFGNFGTATVSFEDSSNTIYATWGAGKNGDTIVALAQGTYRFVYSAAGVMSNLDLSVAAV